MVAAMKAHKYALLFAALLLALGGVAHAGTSKTKLYKWVDRDGVVHYGSSVPPEYASQQSEQLNSQGAVISTTAAQKTPEQLAADAKAKQLADQQAAAAAAAKARDKSLLDTFTSVADMERDRDNKLSAIDAQINVLSGSITAAQNTLAEFQSRATELTAKNKPVPPDLQKHIDASKQQVVLDQQQLLQQDKYKQQTADQYTADIARYKQLTTPQPVGASSGG